MYFQTVCSLQGANGRLELEKYNKVQKVLQSSSKYFKVAQSTSK